MISVTSTWYLQ